MSEKHLSGDSEMKMMRLRERAAGCIFSSATVTWLCHLARLASLVTSHIESWQVCLLAHNHAIVRPSIMSGCWLVQRWRRSEQCQPIAT